MLFVEQKINFNKIETGSRLENLIHAFREMKLVIQLM